MSAERSPQFGRYFAELRRNAWLSLRQFCEEHGFDPGNISKLERGRLAPPRSREKIQEYAKALGVEEGSDEWFEFFDRAHAARGELPQEILEDEEVVNQLPVLFRTLRGDRVTEEEFERLIEVLRRA